MVHPKARIVAEAGPIVIGEGNLIEEQVLIINRFGRYSPLSHQTTLLVLIVSSLLAIFPQLSREHQARHGGRGAQNYGHRNQQCV